MLVEQRLRRSRSMRQIKFQDGELAEWQFVNDGNMDAYLPARLSCRIRTAITAGNRGIPAYA